MSRCNFQLPPIPTPPIPIPMPAVAVALAVLAAIQSALKSIRNIPAPTVCPLD